MRHSLVLLVLGLALPTAAAAQQRRPPLRSPLRGENAAPPRAALERQIIRRFVQQTADEMALPPQGRQRLEQILQESNGRRRELGLAAMDLRQRLATAVRDRATTDEQFRTLLDEATELRNREQHLWRQDQEEIARTLTPRQQAIFVMRWIRFQERIQQMINARPGGPAPPLDTVR